MLKRLLHLFNLVHIILGQKQAFWAKNSVATCGHELPALQNAWQRLLSFKTFKSDLQEKSKKLSWKVTSKYTKRASQWVVFVN